MNPDRFEPPIDRRGTFCKKWDKYAGRDVLPFWVADMDLPIAPFVLDAVRARLEHPILGYTATPEPVAEAFLRWLLRRYGWAARPEWLVWIPGVVPGLNFAARAVLGEGDELLIPAPVYPPFLDVPANSGLSAAISPLARDGESWSMDFERLRAQVSARTAAVLFCNPQNPTGRVYSRRELEELAALVVAGDTVIVSDEIHCPLILDAAKRHIPIASLDDAVADRSVSLFAPTKAYNFPGLACAVAVIPDAALRQRFEDATCGFASSLSPLSYAAALAAFDDRTAWLDEQNAFLAGNAARLLEAARAIDGVDATPVEGTYLAWLDVAALGLADPASHFEAHGLGLSDGEEFGAAGFLRFNFGCSRSLLERGIERLRRGAAAARGEQGK